jgi:cytochrome P450 family 135
MTDPEIRDDLLTLLVAGHETTATEDPERFEPERFLEKPPGTYTWIPWIPFGGGMRRCIGGSFAHFEMQVVLAELVKRRDVRPARAEPERVYRRAITETPRHDAEVVLA